MVVVLRVPAYFRSLICLLKFSYSLGFQLTRNKLFQKRRRSGRPLGFLVGKWIWKMLSIHRSLFEGRKRSVNWSFVVSSPSQFQYQCPTPKYLDGVEDASHSQSLRRAFDQAQAAGQPLDRWQTNYLNEVGSITFFHNGVYFNQREGIRIEVIRRQQGHQTRLSTQ